MSRPGLRIPSLRQLASVVVLLLVFSAPATADIDNVLESLEFYGSLRGHVAGFDGETEIQDNSSRIGLRFSREFGEVRIFARAEWSLNLFDSDFSFNVESSTDTGFTIIDRSDEGDTFGTRLGLIGLDFGNAGQVTIGKQWSAYYDISGWTDLFDVFGGQASFTYNGGTDGGTVGTGRAEKSLIYRNDAGKLQIAAQVQLEAGNDEDVDSQALSLRYAVTDELTLGAAYNVAQRDPALREQIIGLNDDPEYLILGVRYKTERLHLVATWAEQENGDFVNVTEPVTMETVSVFYDASGLEVYGSYDVTDKFRLTGGFNVTDPDEVDPLIHPDFELKYFVIGGRYFFDSRTFAYFEARVDDSIDARGQDSVDVVTAGIRFDFSAKKKTGDGD